MKQKKGFGMWSTTFEDLTGQAIVTRRIVENILPQIGELKNYTFPPKGGAVAISVWSLAVMRLWFDIAFGRVFSLYIVCSRSNFGFLRDIPALIAAKVGVKVIVHSHGSDIISLLNKRKISALARWLYYDCHIVVPSDHLCDPLAPFVRSVHICENFYSGAIKDLDLERKIEEIGLTVLWNSNIMASKGFFDVFAAVMALRADGLPITLIAIGGLVADEELEFDTLNERFTALGKPGWFDYRGRQPHERAIEFLQRADVVCLPSRYRSECQPVAIIEAMCAGKPLIVSETPALRATLADYPAVFVPVNSVDAISSILRTMIQQKVRDPVGFSQARAQFAVKARTRFSGMRFDSEMKSLLIALGGL